MSICNACYLCLLWCIVGFCTLDCMNKIHASRIQISDNCRWLCFKFCLSSVIVINPFRSYFKKFYWSGEQDPVKPKISSSLVKTAVILSWFLTWIELDPFCECQPFINDYFCVKLKKKGKFWGSWFWWMFMFLVLIVARKGYLVPRNGTSMTMILL